MISLLLRRGYTSTARATLARIACSSGLHASVLPYEYVVWLRTLRTDTLIFGDLERLSPAEREMMAQVWNEAEAADSGVRLLNHPTRSMRRYALLRTLHANGQQRHNAYWVTEQRMPERFPVFVRNEAQHDGALTPLLHSPRELQDALADMDRRGVSPDDKLIVEYESVADEEGIHRKYAAFRIGSAIIPAHLITSRHWMSKESKENIWSPETLEQERVYTRENPHEARIREIFDTARIEYGRIDYGVKDGQLVVWEINTNPILVDPTLARIPGREEVRQRLLAGLAEAFRMLDAEAARSPVRIPSVAPARVGLWNPRWKRRAMRAMRMLPARCAYVLSTLMERPAPW